MKQKLTYMLAIALLVVASGCKKQPTGTFAITEEKGNIDPKDPEVSDWVNVQINIAELTNEKKERVELPLSATEKVTLLRKRVDSFDKGRFAWYGELENDPGSFVLLSITKEAVAAKITSAKRGTYAIRYLGKGIHRIEHIDQAKYKDAPDDAVRLAAQAEGAVPLPDCPDPINRIDVMIVYTDTAEILAGGAAGMEATIYLAVYYTNLSYQQSNVNLTMNLVHFEKVTYTESGDVYTDLPLLRDAGDGVMDNVQALRDTYAADLVCLFLGTENNGYCGLGYFNSVITAGFEDDAYSVVKLSCATNYLSFAHETGHNMGADHNCASTSPANTTGTQHGHFVAAPADGSGLSWRTVMSYNACGVGSCTRTPLFSNPNISYSPTGSASTDPTGTVAVAGSCTNDNATVLNTYGPVAAQFRCSSPGVTNVWMRDTWDDTGLEPDPATAGQAMWRSPYIWVRNVQDPTFLHQHEHENPVVGVPNWIYVKMHNGIAEQTGDLEIYYADASASLSWPTGWTGVDTITVTITSNDTRIIEIPWNSPPAAGHYCMIARWVSATDPMAVAEGTNIGDNVRANNNIVWRNMNLVEAAGPDAEADAAPQVFRVRNTGREPFSIELIDWALFPKKAFTHSGKIKVTMDEALMEAWKKGGSKGTGIKVDGNTITVTSASASLDNIATDFKEEMKVNLFFVKGKTTAPDKYDFTVQQTVADKQSKSGKRTIGGVSYEVYTYKK